MQIALTHARTHVARTGLDTADIDPRKRREVAVDGAGTRAFGDDQTTESSPFINTGVMAGDDSDAPAPQASKSDRPPKSEPMHKDDDATERAGSRCFV